VKAFVEDIVELTQGNMEFRRVLHTGEHLQLALMAIRPGRETGETNQPDQDFCLRVEKGRGEVWIDGKRSKIKSDDLVIVPAGVRYNVVNTGDKALKLYVLCAPPTRRDGRPGSLG
jgi:mannose-6-phosphate isomerase-like protein (cupin superfamily)